MDESIVLEEIRNWEHPLWYGNTQFEEKVKEIFLEKQKGLFHHLKTWFLVHVRKLHVPPSRWTQSQTLPAERRIIPYSTEIHWRLQNYSYKLGCFARKPHRWLLEYRWIKRFVWSLDRFHSVCSIKWKTSRRTNVVRVETDKTASDIQARSFMARTLKRISKKCQAEGETLMGNWKTKAR